MLICVRLDGLADKRLSGETWSVLAKLLARMNYENGLIGISQAKIAKALGTSQPNVARAIKILCELDPPALYKTNHTGIYRVSDTIWRRPVQPFTPKPRLIREEDCYRPDERVRKILEFLDESDYL